MKLRYIVSIVSAVLLCFAACLAVSVLPPRITLDSADYDLVIYSTERPEMTAALIPLFEEHYGIQVKLLHPGDLTKLPDEADSGIDLVIGPFPYEFKPYFDKLDIYRSFNEKYMIPQAVEHSSLYTPYAAEVGCLMINSSGEDKSADSTPSEHMLFSGCLLPDPAISSEGIFCMANSLAAAETPEQTRLFCRRYIETVKKNPYLTARQIGELVAKGKAQSGFTYESLGAELTQQGADVTLVYPEKGSICAFRSAAILRGAPHRENARYFIDFLTGKDTQDILGTLLTVRPVRRDARLNSCMRSAQELNLLYLSEEEWQAWADYIGEMQA